MWRRIWIAMILSGAVFLAEVSLAQTKAKSLNRIWFIWENRAVDPDLCKAKSYCQPISTYISRLVEEPNRKGAQSMIGALDKVAKKKKLPVEHPEAPNICQLTNSQTILGFEAESWPLSEKLDALRDLKGVYFSLEKLKPPEGYEGAFGLNVQHAVTDMMESAGISVLTEDEMEQTPGKPHLNIYFSNTNPDTGCWFSVFASLSQTMLLTRNHTVKLKAGTWGTSGGYSADDPDRSEFDAIMMVVSKFISDYRMANPARKKTLKPKVSKKKKTRG